MDCANASQRYVAQHCDAFLAGIPPPDFPGGSGESAFANHATAKDVQSEAGKAAMGLSPLRSDGWSKKNNALAKEVNTIFGL